MDTYTTYNLLIQEQNYQEMKSKEYNRQMGKHSHGTKINNTETKKYNNPEISDLIDDLQEEA